MNMTRALALTIVWLGVQLWPGTAAAQESNFVPTASADLQAPPGWSFTPTLAAGSSWDDNVLVRGNGDNAPGDVVNVLDPRAILDFNGTKGQLSASYDGAFVIYRDLNQLNSFDQHGSLFGRRLLRKHFAVFVRNSAASVPTTELAQLVAVPFVRTGSRLEDFHSGFEASFTKYTSAIVSYNFEWVDFDRSAPGASSLLGGHSHGASMTLRHLLNERLALTADYNMQHATLRDNETFDVENASAGVEYRLSEFTRVFAAGGISRLDVTQISTNRTGPAWRIGLAHNLRTTTIDLVYLRSFVPSYSFGGTMQNEELTGGVRVPIGRRFYTTSSVSWRRNDPLVSGDLPLRSYWIEGSFGGVLDRNRIGFQVITAKPMRIR
jgi:uncharacterized protein (PEP-CTERM system associated)